MLERIKNLFRPKRPSKGLGRYSFYYHHSYALAGEDMLLRHLLRDVEQGFYVDVGAFHPWRFSNTYYFYENGWRGINIDANMESIKLFNKYRPEDKNIHTAVSEEEGVTSFYYYPNQPAVSRVSDAKSHRNANLKDQTKKKSKVKKVPLSKIFYQYLEAKQTIDFLTIDVEGHEMEVIKGNNWQKYRPQFILIELMGVDFKNLLNHPLPKFLTQQNYNLVAKTFNNILFENRAK